MTQHISIETIVSFSPENVIKKSFHVHVDPETQRFLDLPDVQTSSLPIQPAYVFAYRNKWKLQYGNEKASFSSDLYGFSYLQHFLKYPNQQMHVKQLGYEISSQHIPLVLKRHEVIQTFSSESVYIKDDHIIDSEAVKNYRKHLEYLAEERRKAIVINDAARLSEIDSEFHQIVAALDRVKGYRGKFQTLDCTDKILRNRIAKNMNDAIIVIQGRMPDFSDYLRGTIRRGIYMRYIPAITVDWIFI